MKAKTKIQVKVAGLSGKLYSLTEKQKQWSYKTCLLNIGYATKNKVLCLDCGGSFSIELVKRKRAVCPNCQAKITVENSRATTNRQTNYFAVSQIVEEFQVIRNFEIKANYKKGRAVEYYVHEILQYWVQDSGKLTMFGKSHNSSWCMDSWSGDMEIRKETKSWKGDKYDVYPRFYSPDSRFKKQYLKYGITWRLKGMNFLEAMRLLPQYPKAETILKGKQYSLLAYFVGNSYNVFDFWSSVKICLKNKYNIQDAGMYFDYLNLLLYFKKDLHNAKYVCPKDVKKEHDLLMNKKRKIQRAEEAEREVLIVKTRQENLEKAVIEYVDRNKKFFDLELVKGELSIKFLKSIEEFKEEGDELNHCIYTNEYYLRKDSLILSARVSGKRAETIEILIPSMKVQQSRGLNNTASVHHHKIVEIVEKNIPKIRKILILNRKRGVGKAVA
jgi:DNA-directed RNA polymerase subunit RPC12/RpoP